MVKVVDIDPRFVKRISCQKCASILEYTDSEVQTVNGKDYSGGADGHTFVKCPACNAKAIIKSW